LASLLEVAGPSVGQEVRGKALYALGVLTFRQGDYVAARSYLEESLAYATTASDQRDVASALRQLGRMAIDRGELAAARSYLESGLAIEEKLGHEYGSAWCLGYLGLLTHFEGDQETALSLLSSSLATLRRVGDRLAGPVLHYYIGRALRGQGDSDGAKRNWTESLDFCREQRYIWPVPYLLEAFADLAITHGNPERGVTLAGAAAALHEMLGAPLPPIWQADLEQQLRPVQHMLDRSAYAGAWNEGHDLTLDQAIQYALEETPAGLR
jgi:tetratricopeptide (TPR) repeat protein